MYNITKNERPIGFTGPAPAREEHKDKKMERILLETDNGLQISLKDALCNTLATGTTGSGKTGSVGLPCANSLISFGLPGFFTSTKVNFGAKIRSLALAHNRADDIMEYGTCCTARKCNLLAGMDFETMRQFFEDMVKAHTQGVTENWVWLLKGIHQAAQCGQLLNFLSLKFPGYSPTITLISQMLNHQSLAAELYKFFVDNVFDPDKSEHVFFRSAVDCQCFHIMRKPLEKGDRHSTTTEEEQNTWNLQGIRMALQQFLATPGMEQNFCDQNAQAPDMKEAIKNGKLVLAQFESSSGPAGDMLARHLLSLWYGAILDSGPVMPDEIRCFTLLDEFQQIADLGEGRLSDFRFTSLSREYGVINVLLTQSEAALHVNCPNTYRVSGFTTNFNQRFYAYSNDPLTKASAAEFDPAIHLQDLAPMQMFVSHYDEQLRRHVHGLDSLNKAFAATDSLIAANPAMPAPPRESGEEPKKLTDLLKIIRVEAEKIKEMKRKEAEAVKEAEKEERIRQREAFQARQREMARKIQVTVTQEGKMKKGPEISFSATNEDFDKIEQEAFGSATAAQTEKNGSDNEFNMRLQNRFPDMILGNLRGNVPVGWQNYVEKVFALFKNTGLKIKIVEMGLDDGKLNVFTRHDDSRNNGRDVLRLMLAHTENLCMICGNLLPEESRSTPAPAKSAFDDDYDSQDRRRVPICNDCLIRGGLAPWHSPRETGADKEGKKA